MKSLLRHLNKRDWIAVAGAVVLIALSVELELLMPDYMKDITELIVIPGAEIGEILIAGGPVADHPLDQRYHTGSDHHRLRTSGHRARADHGGTRDLQDRRQEL